MSVLTKNLNFTSTDAYSTAYWSIGHSMRHDAFTGMFSDDTIKGLGTALLDGLRNEDGSLYPMDRQLLRNEMRANLDRTPMARLLTDAFKAHLIDVAVAALLPESD